jgi:hypothetical protein
MSRVRAILLRQTAQPQLRQAVEVEPAVRLADGSHDRHRVRLQASSDESEDQS